MGPEEELGTGNLPFLETEVRGRKIQGRPMLKISGNTGQIQFFQRVESRGQGEVLRPRDGGFALRLHGVPSSHWSRGEAGM